jgi:O-methyltransferase involved in polyketide biosynthesis
VAGQSRGDHTASEEGGLPPFDTSTANPARMWDYWLGGKDNFPADQEAAEAILEVMPSLPQTARIARRFLVDVVRRLMLEASIRQFLDIGSGLPTADNTHQVAQRTSPEARIVYVDNDPLVLTHARALLTSTPQGRCAYIHADLRDTKTILSEAEATLDFDRPVAILLLGILHFLPDTDDPYGIVRALMDAMPSGSYLVIGHGARDIQADAVAEMTERYNEHSAVAFIPRTKEEVTRFFEGLELMPPGVVPVHRWWESDPAMAATAEGLAGYTGYCGAGRKPWRSA